MSEGLRPYRLGRCEFHRHRLQAADEVRRP
jgi:hypothetical protein